MTLFKRKAPTVQLSDRFIKRGDSHGNVWVVVRLWTAGDGIPHAQIERAGQQRETRIISVSALADRHFFAPADRPAVV